MIKFSNKEYADMSERLQRIATEAGNNLQRAEQSYFVVWDSMQRLKEFILGYTFKDQQEEIRFFKEIKPRFLKELIYYMELYYIESYKPIGSKKLKQSYFIKEMERISIFFERNQLLYAYYRAGKSLYDEVFFLRTAEPLPLEPGYLPDMDPNFCTMHSCKLAKIQAFEELIVYLQSELNRLHQPIPEPEALATEERPNTTWTDSKVALIELAYAIHSRGSINNGKADVKLVITSLEYAFQISLGNYYAVFQQNIRIRKRGSRTLYLDQLKEFLQRRMDDNDDNPR